MQAFQNIASGKVYSPTSIATKRADKYLLTSLQRKCYLNQGQDGAEIPNNIQSLPKNESQEKSQLSLINQSLLRYFRKRRNLEPIQNKDSAPPIYEVKPEQFESLAEKPTVNIIRDHKEFERPEAYEVVRPFLVFGRTEKLMDKMLPTIAALANEQDGGFIMIAETYLGSVVKTGFPPLGPGIEKAVEQTLQKSLEQIYHHENIQLKADALPIYQDYKRALKNKPKQFVIKVTVMVKPHNRDFFCVKSKIPYSNQDGYSFFSINSAYQPSPDELFGVTQVKGNDIYHLMQNVAMKRLKPRALITKNKSLKQQIILQLEMLTIQPGPKEGLKVSSNFFLTLLTKLSKSKADINQTLEDFKNFNCKQTVVQVQMSLKFKEARTLQKITKLLDKQKVEYQYIVPLQEFQIDLVNQKKQEKPKAMGSVIYYFFLNQQFDKFQKNVQEKFGSQYGDRVILTEVTKEVNLKQLYPKHMQGTRNFLYKFFQSLPKLKKETWFKNDSEILKFNNVKFIFAYQQFHIAIFTYFLLTLGQKKPYSFQ